MEKLVVLGELGLSSEVRPTVGIERMIKQGASLGFTNFIVPKFFENRLKKLGNINIYYASTLSEVRETAF